MHLKETVVRTGVYKVMSSNVMVMATRGQFHHIYRKKVTRTQVLPPALSMHRLSCSLGYSKKKKNRPPVVDVL